MTDQETVAVEVALAKVEGQMSSMREIWALHTTQEAEQFQEVNGSLHEIDTKVDALLLREAERQGEMAGTKRIAIIAATVIPMVITTIGILVRLNVG